MTNAHPKFESKLPHVGTTIFSTMSQLAAEAGAINLGQGYPNFPMDMKLCDLVHKYMHMGFNQYAPMAGVPELRKAISEKVFQSYRAQYNANEEITITSGGTQAIYDAITAFVKPGDEVILFAPAYDCYAPAVELNGGKAFWINLHYPSYNIDWQLVRDSINDRTRMVIINSPHNPTGACLSADDLDQLEKTLSGTDIILLSDEVYEHMVFDGDTHQSCALRPALVARSLIVYSFGKTFHNTGWKIGYVIGPAVLMAEFRKVHQFNVFSTNTPIQYALAEYLAEASVYASLPAMFQQKRDYFLEQLAGSRFQFIPAKGTYFQLLDYSGITGESDTDFAIRLTREFKVTGIPCSAFYPQGSNDRVLRFCFAKDEDTLMKAAQILCTV